MTARTCSKDANCPLRLTNCPFDYADPLHQTSWPDRDIRVQFDFPKIKSGDVPFLLDNLAGAIDVVGDGGVVNIEPGTTPERISIGGGKSFTLVAPIGGVTIGAN